MQQKSFLNIYKKDFVAGIIVFLIALPLCLGIAQASGAPLFSGLVAGIVGGIIVGFLSGSHVSVAGPAAGLTAIVLVAIGEMKAFDIFLCSVIIAGVIQLLLGFAKAGGIANFIPSSVIEGMLAGIGLTIIIKQVPDAVGYAKNSSARMADADDGIVFNFISTSLHHVQPAAIIIALLGIGTLVLWQTKWFKKIQLLPAGLLVVVMGIVINMILKTAAPSLYLDNTHLVNLPVASSLGEFFGHFTLPDLKGFSMPKVWETGAVIAVVASIETLLCIEAADKLDSQKRYTPVNRELKAQGVGNIVSGLLGGLPMTSVIVRTSANINAGARSKMSTIIHGVLLVICAASIPFVLNMIPKAALAAILIFTGYKLCRPSIFKHMWQGGWTQFVPFMATLVAVVSLDLLKGVGIGLVISVFYILRQNMRIPYYFIRNTYSNGDLVKLTLAQEVSFLNKASIKETLENIPANTSLIVDATLTEYIDFDVLDIIKEFHDYKAPEKNIRMSLVGFKDSYRLYSKMTEKEIIYSLMHTDEVPQRTSGGHKDLLQQLSREAGSKHSL
jgi:MFS superfamily sulfate permease-like transporter